MGLSSWSLVSHYCVPFKWISLLFNYPLLLATAATVAIVLNLKKKMFCFPVGLVVFPPADPPFATHLVHAYAFEFVFLYFYLLSRSCVRAVRVNSQLFAMNERTHTLSLVCVLDEIVQPTALCNMVNTNPIWNEVRRLKLSISTLASRWTRNNELLPFRLNSRESKQCQSVRSFNLDFWVVYYLYYEFNMIDGWLGCEENTFDPLISHKLFNCSIFIVSHIVHIDICLDLNSVSVYRACFDPANSLRGQTIWCLSGLSCEFYKCSVWHFPLFQSQANRNCCAWTIGAWTLCNLDSKGHSMCMQNSTSTIRYLPVRFYFLSRNVEYERNVTTTTQRNILILPWQKHLHNYKYMPPH